MSDSDKITFSFNVDLGYLACMYLLHFIFKSMTLDILKPDVIKFSPGLELPLKTRCCSVLI